VSTSSPQALLGDTIVVPGKFGERTTLRFKWTEREAAYNNEVGVFVVDELGRVDGIAPGESGYAQAAIASSSRQIIFSSGQGAGAQRELTFNSGERLGFYIIQNNTTDQWLTLNPQNKLEKGVLAFFSIENVNPDKFDHVFTQTPSNAIVQFFWEDLTGGGNKDFNDVVFTISESRKALSIPGQVGQKVTTKFTWTDREAAYNNELGLFVVDDATGRIGNLLPTDPGYAQAALNNGSRQIIFASSETEGAVKNLELPSGKYVGFYLIQNSTTEHFLRQNPQNQTGKGPLAFFIFPGANPDEFDHIVELPPDQFAWEDLTGGGDKDFDDLVFRYEFGSANGGGNPEPDKNSPVITAGLVRDTAPGGLTNTDKITSDPSITGKVTDKDPITGFIAGINNAPTVNILDALQADGSFSLSPDRLNQIFGVKLTDGSYTVNLQAKDQFGNLSSTFGVTFTLDTQVQTPILDLAADSDSGISNIDNITRDRTPTITGNTENAAIVKLYSGSTLLGETTANSTGIWQITTGELNDGMQNLTVIATDIAGNVSSLSLPLNVVIDTVNPSFNLTNPINTTPLQPGARLTGNADGTGSGIASVSYRFDNLPEIPLVFNAAENFDQVIDFTGINNGDRTLTLTATDIAGNITTRQFNVNVVNGSTVENNAPEIISQAETDYIILRNNNTQIRGITLGTTQAGLAEIQGQAFLDFDRNGVRSKEAGLDGFVVELVNSATGEVVGTQITRSFDVNGDSKIDPFTEQGLYKFTNLQGGSYQVRQVSPDAWNLTLPASSTYNLTLNGGERREGIDFGNAQNYVYEVRGIDADSDTLTYSLVSAPQGATIDRQTGKLIWTPPATGEYAFKIKVADGKGGFDNQAFSLALSNTSPGGISGVVWDDLNGNGVRDTSFAQGANPDIVFVFDVSLSTLSSFQGTPIGNQITNILQAEIAGITALNQQLIRQGLGETARVGIVSFAGDASSIDMNPSVSGIQLLTNPIADNDNNGILDFEQVLQGTNIRLGTNFEVALQESERVFKTIGTTPGNGTLVFLSDGQSFGGSITDEVNKLKALGIKLYAFGVGDGSTLNDGDGLDDDLITIDPNAKIFKNTDELLDTFNNLGGGQNVAEPALSGVQVYLDLNNNGIFDADEPSQLTNNQNNQVQTNSITVAATDAIFLAGRDDITIPPLGTNDPSFPLQRRRTVRPGSVPETFPQSIAVQNNEIFTFEASGSVNFSNGFSPFNPDGNSLRSTIAGLDGISAYNGRTGSLVGLFLNDENPENQTPPTNLNFQIIGSEFTFSTPSIGQVFFIGDGRNSSSQIQQFAAPQGATRLFVGVADGSSLSPGNYEDNTGSYQVTIKSDRLGNDENYSFTGLLPGNYTVRQVVPNGYAQTFPTNTTGNLGSYTVNLAAGDKVENLNFGNQNTTRPNRLPNFITAPPSNGQTGQLFRYEAAATDPDGDVLTYKLLTKPTGMAIDSERGTLVWQPAADQLGNFNVALQVEDGKGGSATQTFQINVGDGVDRELPTVQFGFSSNVVNIGESVTFQVSGTDNNGIANIALAIDGNPVTLNAGSATVQLNKAGVFQVVATATDTTGNVVKKDLSLRVLDPSDTTAPTVEIISPQTNKTITNLTDIVGSVSDDNLEFYRVDYAPLDLVDINNLAATDPDFVTISEGKTNVNKTIIGQFDPTTLFNGNYVLRVTVQDFSGNISSRGVFLGVSGDNKVGNFRLELTDLSIPLAGIPIQINRVYDTLQSSFSGDFGFGWSLGVKDAKIQESVPLTDAEKQGVPSLFGANPFTAGTKVYLTNPEGRRVGFTFDPFIAGGSLLGAFWKPRFVADAGVYDKLEVDDINLQQRSDGSFSLFFIPFAYNPSEYKLTTKDGTTYEYDQFKGLQEVKDRNNNTLTFRDNGIFSSTGASVEFLRDTQGRITQIKDPTGKAILYGYDARGNLVSVSDRNNNATQFVYNNPNRPSFLTEIIDPLGRKGVRTEYDDKGRLARIIDGNGNVTNLGFDANASVQTITDALGNPTTLVYDDRGNIISEINALSGVVQRTYDANNNLLSVKDPLGNTANYTYDSRGNLLSETNGLNQATTFTYNNLNKVVTVTDPLGNKTQNSYDNQGNLLTTTNAAGQTTTYVYDNQGNVVSVTNPQTNATRYEYDSQGRITAIVDARNQKSLLTYDNNGNLLTTTTPLGNTTRFTYDGENRPVVVTDALGNVSRIEYNASGDRTATIDALGRRTEYIYDNRSQLTAIRYANGRRTNSIDRGGRVTNFVYDALGRLVETIAPDSTPTNLADNPRIRREYDAAGRLIVFVDERGNRTQYGYDAAGRQILIRDALGNLTRNAYNANGEVVTVTDALNRATQFVYDPLGRIVETRLSDGTKTITTYDALDRVIAETDQAGITTQFEYDALDRLTAVVDALGQRTEYGYDAEGNLISQRDAKGNTTTYQYDAVSQRFATILPLGQRSTQTYDAVGNVTSFTDFNGKTITYRYNSNDQIITEGFADGTSVNYTYTPTLQRATVTDSRGVTSYTYNERDQLTTRTEVDGRTIGYTYDIAGNRTSLTTPAGTVGYTYDALNRMQTVSDRSGGVTRYVYDAVGNLVRTELPNNTVETRRYDNLDRLVSVEQRGASGVIAGYEYTLGLAGNRLAVTEANGRQVNYAYDQLYRLVQEAISDPTAGNRTIGYTYDAVGNRLSRNDSGEGVTTYSYDDNDRFLREILNGQTTEYTYDDNGSTLTVKVNGTDQVNYRWDDQGRLIGADIVTPQGTQRIEYRYDADGNRVAVIFNGEETRYLVDTEEAYAEVVEEYKPDGTIQKSYVRGLDLISQDQQGQESIHHAAGLGSVNALTDGNGNVTDRYIYDAFGRLIGQQGNTDNDFGFTGEQFDENSDLYYLRARYYNPENGRFISKDSFEGFLDDPQSLHKYTYVHNDPVNLIDPSGNVAAIDLGVISQRVSIPVALALAGGAAFALLTPEQKAQLARAAVAAVPIYKLEAVVKSAFVNGGLLFGTLVALEAISKALRNLPDNPNPPAPPPPLPPFTPPGSSPPLPPFTPPGSSPPLPPFAPPSSFPAFPPILEKRRSGSPPDEWKDTLPGFSGTVRTKSKTPVQGGGGMRERWKDKKGKIYEWDSKKGTVEVYNPTGKIHLGEFHPKEGTQVGPRVPSRKVEP
jgi:RHS repeat-associated protein